MLGDLGGMGDRGKAKSHKKRRKEKAAGKRTRGFWVKLKLYPWSEA